MTLKRQEKPLALPQQDDEKLGRLSVERKLLSKEQLDEARTLAGQWGVSLTDALMARRWAAPYELFKTVAAFHKAQFVDLGQKPPAPELISQYSSDDMVAHMAIPVRTIGDGILVATSQPTPATYQYIRETFGTKAEIGIATPSDIIRALQEAFREQHTHKAVYGLADLDPEMSAQQVFVPVQVISIYVLVSVFLIGCFYFPTLTLIIFNAALGTLYLGNFLFKGFLVWAGGQGQERNTLVIAEEVEKLRDEELPIVTVLVPMFKEPEVLPILANALRQLDYPLAKLDIKIVLEETDHETIQAAIGLGLEGIFEVILVPECHPQTKPKACNYALNYARGEYLVIYDAEDKPEPDQIKKVIAAFRTSPKNTACIQCRLNYYNARENWLTRMFTLDYSLWFDLMLPGLERLGIPIPLGGTSNHFRMDVLKELHAWDPFNVTEDADLGIRLTQKGYCVGVIESTTFEEANVSIPNWVRQRSRWVKGYMQTFLVHTRRPIHLFRTIGPTGLLGFVAFIGGTFLTGLLNPISWSISLIWLIFGSQAVEAFFPPILLYMSLANLLIGNGLLVYLTMIAPLRRNWTDLAPWGLSVIAYWVLMTVASYKALSQLLFNPFYWEKTQHGLSKHTAAEVANATIADQQDTI